MNKLSLAAVSLVAAIPAGFLAVLMALAFLRHAEHMKTTLLVLAGLTLAVSALVTVMPFGILIFGAKDKRGKQEAGKDKTTPDDDDGEEDTSDDDSADGLKSSGDEDDFAVAGEDGDVEMDNEDADLEMADDGDDFGFADDDFDMDDEEES